MKSALAGQAARSFIAKRVGRGNDACVGSGDAADRGCIGRGRGRRAGADLSERRDMRAIAEELADESATLDRFRKRQPRSERVAVQIPTNPVVVGGVLKSALHWRDTVCDVDLLPGTP